MGLNWKKKEQIDHLRKTCLYQHTLYPVVWTYLCFFSVLVGFFTALVHCKIKLSIPWSHWLHHYTILFINELKIYVNWYLNFLKLLIWMNTSLVLNLVSPITCLQTLWNCLCVSQPCLQNKEEATFGTFFLQSCATLFFSLSSQWSHFIHVHVVCLRLRIGH